MIHIGIKYGACIGTISLQKKIDPDFSYNITDIEVEELPITDMKDLARFASLHEKLNENTWHVSNFFTEVTFPKSNISTGIEEYTSNSKNDKTVLFIGDSFSTDMQEYFSKIYKDVKYIHRNDWKEEVLETYKPDIVIIEAVERLSSAIGYKLFK